MTGGGYTAAGRPQSRRAGRPGDRGQYAAGLDADPCAAGRGRIAPAREALARHHPDPKIGDEARPRFELRLAVPLTGDDARTLRDLAGTHLVMLPPATVLPMLHRRRPWPATSAALPARRPGRDRRSGRRV